MGHTNGCFDTSVMPNNQVAAVYNGAEVVGNADGISLNASRSSAIYKSVSKIQVRSAQLLMIIKS